MAKKCYNTEEIMKEREQYPERRAKERATGQDLQGRANGKSQAGGNKRGGGTKR